MVWFVGEKVNEGEKRSKQESKEEKRARKQKLKDAKRLKKQQKKERRLGDQDDVRKRTKPSVPQHVPIFSYS